MEDAEYLKILDREDRERHAFLDGRDHGIVSLKPLIIALSERIYAQSEILSRNAEKRAKARCPVCGPDCREATHGRAA